MKETNILIGRNPIKEALKSDRTVDRLLVQKGSEKSAGDILALAKSKGVRIDQASKAQLDKLSAGQNHQGVACYVSNYEYASLEDLLERAGAAEQSVLIVLDELEDPHNLGAIMRTAECTGAHGVIIPKRRSAGLTETVAKTSAGAIEYLPCARVSNIAQTIEKLKEAGYWIYGADMDGESLWDCKLDGKIAIVIGNEGKGLSRLVREKCDVIISIPMVGKIESLNASNAAAVILYEAFRQRQI